MTADEDTKIKIEDILLYFNEDIKIQHFKEEICKSLRVILMWIINRFFFILKLYLIGL